MFCLMYQYRLPSLDQSDWIIFKILSNRLFLRILSLFTRILGRKVLLFVFFFNYCFFNDLQSFLILSLYFSISLEKYNFFDSFLVYSKSFLKSWHSFFVFKNFKYKRYFLSEHLFVPIVIIGLYKSQVFYFYFIHREMVS